jgi:DNA-binding transcriptional regulator PaaX
VESHPDRNDERLQRACDLLTQVADTLQGDLGQLLLQDIPQARAGGVIRLAVQVERLNQLAAQVWDLRQTRAIEDTFLARMGPGHV